MANTKNQLVQLIHQLYFILPPSFHHKTISNLPPHRTITTKVSEMVEDVEKATKTIPLEATVHAFKNVILNPDAFLWKQVDSLFSLGSGHCFF